MDQNRPEISLAWPVSPLRGTISADEIHVWAWSLESSALDLSAGIELLDHQELQRLRQFYFVPDRQRYAAAHANLRRILGAYLGQPPGQICIRANRFGKPELADSSSSLSFNLSHSKTIAVVAVGYGPPIGVDVEDIRPIEPEVADTHFSAAELSELRKFEGDAWLSGFYRCWTRKEAILKAEGVGLHIALDSFDVGLSAKAELLGTRHSFSQSWKLHHLAPCDGVIGALATALPGARLRCFSL
jgi:4'-phosphopantetheinyl transferase